MGALDELAAGYEAARPTRPSRPRSTSSAATTSAGPRRSTSPSGWREESGARIWLKREDLNHTGAHKINNAVGQALLADRHRQAPHRRGDRRRPARRRHRDRVRAVRARVPRLHGRGGHPPPAPQRRPHAHARRRAHSRDVGLGDAQGRHERGDPRLDHERRDDPLPDRVGRGPAPVSGARARPPVRDRPRGTRADPRARGPPARRRLACVGGGTNAIGLFHPFLEDGDVALWGAEAGGGTSTATRPRSRTAASRVLHGSRTTSSPTPTARCSSRTPSPRPGLPRCRAGALLAEGRRPGPLRARHRRRGARRLPPDVRQGGDHPGARVGPRRVARAPPRPPG